MINWRIYYITEHEREKVSFIKDCDYNQDKMKVLMLQKFRILSGLFNHISDSIGTIGIFSLHY